HSPGADSHRQQSKEKRKCEFMPNEAQKKENNLTSPGADSCLEKPKEKRNLKERE
ncbi:18409_t:CDS:2, partial [Gigaspora margarita]